MDNFGKAIYMAAFALLFIVAASTAIYLYGTLTVYLSSTTNVIGISGRAEGLATGNGSSSSVREITKAEILISIFQMEQMHLSKVTVGNYSVTKEDVEAYLANPLDGGKMALIIPDLEDYPNARYSYSYHGSEVTYKRMGS